jgi:hypothetical protein
MRDGYQLSCYDDLEGHGQACEAYYRKGTVPHPCEKEALQAFNNYIADWEGDSVPVLRKKLKWKV